MSGYICTSKVDGDASSLLARRELSGSTVFISTPRRWLTAVVGDGGTLFGHDDAVVDLGDVFALEGFHPDTGINFRWRLTAEGGVGATIGSSDVQTEESSRILSHIDTEYLLWGSIAEVDDDWVRLHETRVGSIWIPFTGSHACVGSRARMTRREYITRSHDGIAVVADELYIRLTVESSETES